MPLKRHGMDSPKTLKQSVSTCTYTHKQWTMHRPPLNIDPLWTIAGSTFRDNPYFFVLVKDDGRKDDKASFGG